ncbi:MAG TPA: DNA methyltransferase, partial [Candidatus Sulfotelmatobacter sp.]|nr:DNA methyltransferase [Candidatus Sulfotelmatobacter sp.]
LEEDVFWDKFVLEYVVREFLLLVLLLYQLLVATSGAGDGLESDLPQVKSTPAGNPLINLVSNTRMPIKPLSSIDEVPKKRRPVNRLNDLSGKEWIKFTKSWFKHSPPPRDRTKLIHPAGFPETLVREFVEFFTKPNMWVLDPFLGTGSTLIAARAAGRNAIGIEISARYASMAKSRLEEAPPHDGTRQLVIRGNSIGLQEILAENKVPQVDFCITSPPYWNQLKRASLRQRERKQKGLDTDYSNDPDDIGNIAKYEVFLDAQKKIFDGVYGIMKEGGYLVVVTNNVFSAGRLHPLAFETLTSLANTWVPKDEKLWLHDDKRLLPLGIYNAWVGNRSHQYCLIFRKEL